MNVIASLNVPSMNSSSNLQSILVLFLIYQKLLYLELSLVLLLFVLDHNVLIGKIHLSLLKSKLILKNPKTKLNTVLKKKIHPGNVVKKRK
jgi:hypothetical protein